MGLFRLIIWGGLIYFGYKVIKRHILPNILSDNKPEQARDEAVPLMVKDPVCEIYLPKQDSIHVRMDEEDFYFCSKECRNKFLALRSER